MPAEKICAPALGKLHFVSPSDLAKNGANRTNRPTMRWMLDFCVVRCGPGRDQPAHNAMDAGLLRRRLGSRRCHLAGHL